MLRQFRSIRSLSGWRLSTLTNLTGRMPVLLLLRSTSGIDEEAARKAAAPSDDGVQGAIPWCSASLETAMNELENSFYFQIPL